MNKLNKFLGIVTIGIIAILAFFPFGSTMSGWGEMTGSLLIPKSIDSMLGETLNTLRIQRITEIIVFIIIMSIYFNMSKKGKYTQSNTKFKTFLGVTIAWCTFIISVLLPGLDFAFSSPHFYKVNIILMLFFPIGLKISTILVTSSKKSKGTNTSKSPSNNKNKTSGLYITCNNCYMDNEPDRTRCKRCSRTLDKTK